MMADITSLSPHPGIPNRREAFNQSYETKLPIHARAVSDRLRDGTGCHGEERPEESVLFSEPVAVPGATVRQDQGQRFQAGARSGNEAASRGDRQDREEPGGTVVRQHDRGNGAFRCAAHTRPPRVRRSDRIEYESGTAENRCGDGAETLGPQRLDLHEPEALRPREVDLREARCL